MVWGPAWDRGSSSLGGLNAAALLCRADMGCSTEKAEKNYPGHIRHADIVLQKLRKPTLGTCDMLIQV